jgi:hypothetical protein
LGGKERKGVRGRGKGYRATSSFLRRRQDCGGMASGPWPSGMRWAPHGTHKRDGETRHSRGLGDSISSSPLQNEDPSHLDATARQRRAAGRTGGHVQVALFLSLTLGPMKAPGSRRRPRLLHVQLAPVLQPPLPTDLALSGTC